MKSYFLEDIASHLDVAAVLSQLLPGRQKPWLLLDSQGDVIAYYNADPCESDPHKVEVMADMSGRQRGQSRRRYSPPTAICTGRRHPR